MAIVSPQLARGEQVGSWTVIETVSPLTDAKTLTASTPSTVALLNQLNLPQTASLILRCQEGVRAAYVSWPQVLNAPFHSYLLNLPETLVVKKLDDGPISSDTWVVSEGGMAAGSFDNMGAPKILASLHGAKRLVIRMTGLTQQDAVFDLTNVDEVIGRVEAVCGGGKVVAILPAVVESPLVEATFSGPPEAELDMVASALTKEGFIGVMKAVPKVVAPSQPYKLTSRLADCGRMLGIPYLADRRVKTQVAVQATAADGRAKITLTISAVMKTGMGAPDKPLQCTSTGVLEREVLSSGGVSKED